MYIFYCANKGITMKITKKNPLLGAHMSISGGVKNALISGESIGCTAVQLFTANNRQWSLKTINKNDVQEFLEHKKTSPIQIVVSHASYLINLGSPNKDVAEKSIRALEAELQRCDQIGVPYTVIHPGASLGTDESKCLDRIAKNLSTALENSPGQCMVLLENTAGQGSNLGYNFEQLATIMKNTSPKKRIGVCFDTCHAFAAGYDFRDKKSYNTLWKDFDSIVGLEHLKVIHLNDSKKECGSRVDRHEHIGEGKIGKEGFKHIMNDNRFIDIPKILETPKEKDLKDDVKNLATLKKLVT